METIAAAGSKKSNALPKSMKQSILTETYSKTSNTMKKTFKTAPKTLKKNAAKLNGLSTVLALTLGLATPTQAELYLEKSIAPHEAGKTYIEELHKSYSAGYGKQLFIGGDACAEAHGFGINEGANVFIASSTHLLEGKIMYHQMDVRQLPEEIEAYACMSATGLGEDMVLATANALENALTNRAAATTVTLAFQDGETGEQVNAGLATTKVGVIASYKETFRIETDQGTYTSLNICFGPPLQQNIVSDTANAREKENGKKQGFDI